MPKEHGAEKITIKINDRERSFEVEPRLLLVDLLRDVASLTGTHIGCDVSICGACTVMLNGATVKSCTVLAVQADDAEILTIEGLAPGDKLHPIQEAFWDCHGLQCGFCTPGMILSAYQLLKRNPRPTENEIRHAIDGHLCPLHGLSTYRRRHSKSSQSHETNANELWKAKAHWQLVHENAPASVGLRRRWRGSLDAI